MHQMNRNYTIDVPGLTMSALYESEEEESVTTYSRVGKAAREVATSEALRSQLTSWSASSLQELTEAGGKRVFMFEKPPDLECIVCERDINDTPVYQCQTGHLACHRCSHKGDCCPSCSKAISRIKNVAVGNIINKLRVSCKYAELGCKEMGEFREPRSKHKDVCEYAPMNCPMGDCNQAGVKILLHKHLADYHIISSVIDICQKYVHNEAYESQSGIFDLDSSTTSVLLRHEPSKEFHVLVQESTALGDRLQITPLAKSCKRKYEINVEIDEDQAYCYKSTSKSGTPQRGGLLIPKLSDSASSVKKHCKIKMAM